MEIDYEKLLQMLPPMKEFFNSSTQRMDFFDQTIQYQIDNGWSPESKELADWARNYKYETR